MSNVRKASMARITAHTTSTELSSGSVTKRSTLKRPAPSMAAASNGSRGRLCSPASSSSVNQGVHSQTSVSTITANAVQRCASHGWPSKPSASSTTFTMPN